MFDERDRAFLLLDWIEQAAIIVTQHWPSIERVAKALLKHTRIRGDDVRKLYRESERGRAPLSPGEIKRLAKAIREQAARPH